MSTPAPAATPYTLLETLLLFHAAAALGGAQRSSSSSFAQISAQLLKNPVVAADATFDRARLAPDALRAFFAQTLRRAAAAAAADADEPAVVRSVAAHLYERYRSSVADAIRADERRHAQLRREIAEIAAGAWDARLRRAAAPVVVEIQVKRPRRVKTLADALREGRKKRSEEEPDDDDAERRAESAPVAASADARAALSPPQGARTAPATPRRVSPPPERLTPPVLATALAPAPLAHPVSHVQDSASPDAATLRGKLYQVLLNFKSDA